jgi:NAD+ synthase (glutamine-hydrolysing)
MTAAPFASIHSHGFIRVAACTPRVAVGDPQLNAQATLALARQGHVEHVDLMIFPELGLSAYAIDDLLLQEALLDDVEREAHGLIEASSALRPILVVGAPVRRNGRLYNCALIIGHGQLLGVVPKSYLPNYREYYEKRWFAPGAGVVGHRLALAGTNAPFGTDLLFRAAELQDFCFHVEICEDFWAPLPPSTAGALAGALILCNLSASNIVVGKADERAMLCASQSVRCQAAYVYSAAGPGESTTDLAWDGQATIHELGAQLACTERFPKESQWTVADVDVQRLRLERMRTPTFNDAAVNESHPESRFRQVDFSHPAAEHDIGLRRVIDRFPFVPDDPARLDRDCYETFNIQAQGLMQRLRATGIERIVIGISGGLDSTHALLVAAKAFDTLGLPRERILGFTLPGFGTSDSTRHNAWELMRALGITAEEIDIQPLARQMLADLHHPFARGEEVFDVTFENVQAGLRTDYLFRAANQRNALVLGTSDLSELALGWCTYGVGDHMSHYNVNGSLAKTLIQHLVRWVIASGQFDAATSATLRAILETQISPELVPQTNRQTLQGTESKIGPYELQDFNLFHITRYGLPPSKVAFLAWHAWRSSAAGVWPEGIAPRSRNEYTLDDIKKWLRIFLQRFFELSQFKRSALPNSPKVISGGNLSPRGDWRAPSDGTAAVWLRELDLNVPDAVPEQLNDSSAGDLG